MATAKKVPVEDYEVELRMSREEAEMLRDIAYKYKSETNIQTYTFSCKLHILLRDLIRA